MIADDLPYEDHKAIQRHDAEMVTIRWQTYHTIVMFAWQSKADKMLCTTIIRRE